MVRQPLLQKLNEYTPHDVNEIDYKNRMLLFINQYPNCFERTLEIGHITASAWLLNNDNTQALLMHHRKLDKWVQLGGHCDGNPDVLAVAIKEAQEESGIMHIEPVHTEIFDIDIHLIPTNTKEKEHYHYDVRFLLQVKSNEKMKQNSESKKLRWVSRNKHELPTQEQSVIRMFNKWNNLSN